MPVEKTGALKTLGTVVHTAYDGYVTESTYAVDAGKPTLCWRTQTAGKGLSGECKGESAINLAGCKGMLDQYVTKYKTLYKERTVYVPVYDDPFWNPATDGRVAGEGVGMPEASPHGALPYQTGSWYEHGTTRHNMLDALGGTLDTDRDVDDPADLGVWWGDSLPSGRMRSSLSDSDSF